jgi:hypothetical protein
MGESGEEDVSGIFNAGSDFPPEWDGTNFQDGASGGCHPLRGEDNVSKLNLSITEVTSDTLKGTFSLQVEGAGPREGSTLVVDAAFNLSLKER